MTQKEAEDGKVLQLPGHSSPTVLNISWTFFFNMKQWKLGEKMNRKSFCQSGNLQLSTLATVHFTKLGLVPGGCRVRSRGGPAPRVREAS